MKKKLILVLTFLGIVAASYAQEENTDLVRFSEFNRPSVRKNINIPDVNGYKVLKCDFHMHTVFSDGLVWPTIRMQEAWEEGLDAFSLTEHVEFQRYAPMVAIDVDKPHELIAERAKRENVILIRGAEISRFTPPGHFNSIFIENTTPFIRERVEGNQDIDRKAILEAAKQKAFIFWNHPGWRGQAVPGSYEWSSFLDDLVKNNALHGIEVFNGTGFHKKALDWCVDKNLTVIGNTDIHGLVNFSYDTSKEYVHRTMTLVMTKDRTAESIREALKAGRTVAWASKYLAGKEENVKALFHASVKLLPSHYTEENKNGDKTNHYELQNNSDLYFELELTKGKGTKKITLYPQSTVLITARAGQTVLKYDVTTAYVRSDKFLSVDLALK